MPADGAVQYFEESPFPHELGTTTTGRRPEPARLSYDKFWQEYHSSMERETELDVKRKRELQIKLE